MHVHTYVHDVFRVQNRLQLSKGENDTMWYKLVQEEKAKKLTGLS